MLLVRKERTASLPLLSLGLRLGVALSLLLWVTWDAWVDPLVFPLQSDPNEASWWRLTTLPIYRCCFAVALAMYATAACLHIWKVGPLSG